MQHNHKIRHSSPPLKENVSVHLPKGTLKGVKLRSVHGGGVRITGIDDEKCTIAHHLEVGDIILGIFLPSDKKVEREFDRLAFRDLLRETMRDCDRTLYIHREASEDSNEEEVENDSLAAAHENVKYVMNSKRLQQGKVYHEQASSQQVSVLVSGIRNNECLGLSPGSLSFCAAAWAMIGVALVIASVLYGVLHVKKVVTACVDDMKSIFADDFLDGAEYEDDLGRSRGWRRSLILDDDDFPCFDNLRGLLLGPALTLSIMAMVAIFAFIASCCFCCCLFFCADREGRYEPDQIVTQPHMGNISTETETYV